jgi:hypothetical protein
VHQHDGESLILSGGFLGEAAHGTAHCGETHRLAGRLPTRGAGAVVAQEAGEHKRDRSDGDRLRGVGAEGGGKREGGDAGDGGDFKNFDEFDDVVFLNLSCR